jgi:hypothetical protein
MHDTHTLMVGMFWGGVLMALPPVALSIGVVIYIWRRQRAARQERVASIARD